MLGGDGFAPGEGAVYAATGILKDAGSATNTIVFGLNDGTKKSNYNITLNEGTLTIEKRNVTLTSADASKTYDGTPLTNSTVTVGGDGFPTAEGGTYSATGTITDAGSTPNAITYTLSAHTKAGNYNITLNEGTLTVNKRNVTLTSADASKTYDGTPLTSNTVTVGGDGFAPGEGAAYSATGTITDAGSITNTITYYSLNSNTKESNYTFTKSEGTLTVDPVPIELYSTTSYVFNGSFQNVILGAYCSIQPCTVTSTGENTWQVTNSIGAGVTITATTSGGGIDVGFYPTSITLNSSTSSNFSIEIRNYDMIISELTVSITNHYDYTTRVGYLTSGVGTVEEIDSKNWNILLPWGDLIHVYMSNGITNTGSRTITVVNGNADNYYIIGPNQIYATY